MGKFRKSGPGARRGNSGGSRPGKKTFKSGPARPSRFKKSSDSAPGREKSFDRSSRPERSERPFKREDSRDDKPFSRSARPASKDFRDRKEGDREKRPFQKRGDSEERGKRPYQKRTEGGNDGKRPYQKRMDNADREKRPYQQRDESTSRPERPVKRESRDRDERPFKRRGDAPAERFDKKSSGEGSYLRRDSKRKDDYPSRSEEGDAREEKKFSPEKRERPAGRTGERKSFSGVKRDESSSPRPRISRGENEDNRNGYRGKRSDESFKRKEEEGADTKKWNRKESHEFYGDRKKSGKFEKGPKKLKVTAADEGLTRLNKFISNAGICSRREADEMIKAGVITVNGEVVSEMGYKVQPGDVVKYNNETLRGERLVYILLNKPKDFITTTDDPEERKTVMSLIANAGKERVYPVGRLDRNTTGILLFTNDGDLARKLTHPSFEVQKVYQVELDRSLKSSDLDAIAEGIKLEDGFVKVDDIAFTTDDKSILGVELHSGKNRIVRRLFEHLGYTVKKLDRVIFAGLTKKDLPRGRWRFLTDMEVANLKMITGSKKFVGKMEE